jgi:hypothetical protein
MIALPSDYLSAKDKAISSEASAWNLKIVVEFGTGKC